MKGRDQQGPMASSFITCLRNGAYEMGISLTDSQISLMCRHAKELDLWNQKINLTAITDPQESAEKHFVDSLVAKKFMDPDQQILDMGSGPGFPGLPLKIMDPEQEFVLVDSSRKKINFLKHLIRCLDLDKIQAVHSRVEDLHQDKAFAGQFRGVISRAFSGLEKFVILAQPFLKPGGTIYAMKGKLTPGDITPFLKENFIVRTDHYRLPFEKSHRHMVRFQKK